MISTMDFHKYYKIDLDGMYNLHFVNKDRLNMSEIRSIFSSYGKVMHISFTKDQAGFVFIKYKTLQETICCLKGLKDDSKIQLLPERSKVNNFNKRINNEDSNQQQVARTGNSFQQKFNKQLDSDNFTHNVSNVGEDSTCTKAFNENTIPNFLDINNQNFTHKPNLNGIKDNKLDSPVLDGKSLPFSLPSKQTFTETNSSDIIDYEKYYRISKDNTYIIHFANKKGLTFEKIHELFSVYGTVLSLYSGSNKILVFVRYKTLEEIIRCMKGLQNNNMISILPQKDKISEITDQRNSNQWQAARTEDTPQKIFSNGKQFNSNSIHDERSLENRDTFKDTDNFSDTASHSSRQNYHFNESEIKYKNTSSQKSNEKYSFLEQQNHTINEDYDQMRKKQQETKLYASTSTETDVKRDRDMRINTHDYEIPGLISYTETKSSDSNVISDSLLSSGIKSSSSKIVYIPMQEIIVANIHMNYSVHYILHLFEKHDPISATLVKIIPENNIRYCHVYFKTIQDAIAVEEEFDNFDLSGKNLIVLRKSRLIGETTYE